MLASEQAFHEWPGWCNSIKFPSLPPKKGMLPCPPLLVAMQSCVSCALTLEICCWTSLTWESQGKKLELYFAHFSGDFGWVMLNWQSLQWWVAGQGLLQSVNGGHWSCAHVVPLEKGGMQWQRVLPFCSLVFLETFYLLLCFGWKMLLYLQPVLRLIILNLPAFATIYFHCGSLL